MKFPEFSILGTWSYTKSRKLCTITHFIYCCIDNFPKYETRIFANIRIHRKQQYWGILRRFSCNLYLKLHYFSKMGKNDFCLMFWWFLYDISDEINGEQNIPVGNYLLKFKNRNARTTCQIYSKLTIKTPVSLLLILNIFHTLLSILN